MELLWFGMSAFHLFNTRYQIMARSKALYLYIQYNVLSSSLYIMKADTK